MYEFNLVLLLLQQMCVFLVIAWLMSKTRLFIPLMQVTVRLPHKLLCYVTFSIFCILGTYLGLHIEDSIANTRAIGAVMGGLLGGPVVGGLVGLTGGLHRYSMGGMTALSCMISTIVEGLLGGLIHSVMVRRGRPDKVFSPLTAGMVTLVAELVQMMIILLIARPFEDAVHLVSSIAAPMMVTNTLGAALFMRILLDKRAMFEKYTSAFSATALKVAASTEGILRQGFNEENSMKVAQVLHQELDIKLYEAKNRLFSSINRTLGEGIAQLLSAQILAGQYERQKALLTQSEIKLLHAQVNPHFLFNALNTLKAVIRRDSEQATQLVQFLSTFFRKNLKRPSEIVTLADEIEHVNAYLQIEQARFQSRLQVSLSVPEELAWQQLPAFTLQPIVENAIKHGTSQLLGTGEIAITASRFNRYLVLDIEDNAGLYTATHEGGGLGMGLVDKRLRAHFGEDCGITVVCEPDCFTRITLRLPLEEHAC